jgi:hypothetical protein
MRDTQPLITDDEEYQGYQKARDTLTDLVREREQRLFTALNGADEELIEDRRTELLNVLRKRQGIINAIKAYEGQRHQSAS